MFVLSFLRSKDRMLVSSRHAPVLARHLRTTGSRATVLLVVTAVGALSWVTCSCGTGAGAASVSAKVIPFTQANVAEQPNGSYDVSWQAPSTTGKVTVYAGVSAVTDGTNKVGGGGSRASIVVRPPTSTTVARWYFTLTPTKGASLILADRSLHVADAPNLRDVGGYRTTDGQWVRMGLLYRSDALNDLTPADQAELSDLGVTTVVDLRTTAERTAAPDKLPSGMHYVVANVFAGPFSKAQGTALLKVDTVSATLFTSPNKRTTTVAATIGTMAQLYGLLPILPSADAAYATLFTTSATASSTSAVIFHCTAGKDRTGWGTAALLLELGVPLATVEQDYLLSNKYVLPPDASTVASYVAAGGKAAVADAVLGVERQYLVTALNVVKRHYGSIQNYFTEGLGLSTSTIAALNKNLLEGSPD